MKLGTANLKAIAEMAPPRTYTEIQHFTGMTGFFWQFIKGYSKIAKPLNDLLEGEASKLKAEEVELPLDALKAFEELKLRCMTAPVLVFADFKKPFRLETDASKEGLGAVLLQESDDGQYHPVAFASHELKGGEAKYHSSKLEFLALKWAVTKQFHEYLQYQPFTVRTDNNPLTYILMTPNLDTLGHRWVVALASYNMKLEYLKGSDNKVVDALSRVSTQKLDEETITELRNYARNGSAPRAETANIHLIEEGEHMDQEVIVRYTQIVKQHKNFRNLANQDWVIAQSKDPVIPHVIKWIQQPRKDHRKLEEYLTGVASDYERRFYAARQKEFTLQDNLLYLQVTPINSQDTVPVFVILTVDRQAAIDSYHCSAGHQGCDRTLSLMNERFWWPGMSQALLKAVANCVRCIQYEAKGQLPPMQPIICTEPMELVHIDYVGMEVTVATDKKPVVRNVLVVIDHFTHYVQAFVTKNHTARTTARVLYNNYFSVFGFTQRLMSDQGTEFCGKVIVAMCSLLGVEKTRTTPYHPQTNGSAERVHQTLQHMIGKLDPEKRKWPAHIGSIIIAYNSTRSLVTRYSPYYLMFGCRPRLPINLLFPMRQMQMLTRTIDEYVASLYDRLQESLAIAQDCAVKEAQRQKRLYDHKVGAVELRPGDHVLVHLDAFRGQRRKLKNRWGDDLHTVVTCVADGIPPYVVKNNHTGKKKVVHRARLLLLLTDYGEPVRCNLVDISVVPPGTATDQYPQGCEGDNLVPGCSLQYSLDLTAYLPIIDDPEQMSSKLGCKVHAGAPQNVAGQMIVTLDEEETCPECLGSYSEDIPCS